MKWLSICSIFLQQKHLAIYTRVQKTYAFDIIQFIQFVKNLKEYGTQIERRLLSADVIFRGLFGYNTMISSPTTIANVASLAKKVSIFFSEKKMWILLVAYAFMSIFDQESVSQRNEVSLNPDIVQIETINELRT